jgi:hypothetical protein
MPRTTRMPEIPRENKSSKSSSAARIIKIKERTSKVISPLKSES